MHTLKMFLVFIAVFLPLNYSAAQETDLVPAERAKADAKESYLLRQRIYSLTAKMRSSLIELKTNVPESNEHLESALTYLEKGISSLEAMRPQEELKKQILVEACFIEISDLETNKSLSDIRVRWEGGEGVPTIATEKSVQKLKAHGTSITAPSLLVLDGQDATIETVDKKEFSYLERRSGNLYEMKKTTVDDGLSFALKSSIITSDKKEFVRIESTMVTTSVLGRTPCNEGAETIGLPVISSRTSEMNLTVTPGQWFLVPATKLESAKKPLLICVIKATILE